jgi:predicted MFS family arabinose efflux permease
MMQLIVYRAIQGLGAGGLIPLGMTILAELYTLRERARMQALFSGVWGLASIAGPLVGGYVTDALSWRWVFYINIPAGLLALAIITVAYPASSSRQRVAVDWTGAALLFAGISAVLLALSGEGNPVIWAAASAVLLSLFVVVERRTSEPILPLDLLTNRLISRAFAVVFLAAAAMFGAIAFVPLFVQVVLGGTATEAGQVLTPLFFGWVVTAIVGARATLQFGYRTVAITGAVIMAAGFAALETLSIDTTRTALYMACLIIGAGMGLQMLSLLLAVQHSVERSRLGIATSMNAFARNVGAAVGVAAMGAIVSRGVAGLALPSGADALASSTLALSAAARLQFATALHRAFIGGTIASAAAIAGALLLPAVDFSGAHGSVNDVLESVALSE